MASPITILFDRAHNAAEIAKFNTIPTRFTVAYHAALVIELRKVADHIVDDAKAQLQPGHGYDTGNLHDAIVYNLARVVGSVVYLIEAPGAEYWPYVEFGHVLRNGDWWEGYHFLQNAVSLHQHEIWDAAHKAMMLASAATVTKPDAITLMRGF